MYTFFPNITQDKREEYFSALGEAYFQSGDYEKALPLFKEATEIAPEQSEYWVKYARFLVDLDKIDEALDVIDEGEGIFPKFSRYA